MKEELAKVGHMLGYSVAAVIGVIAANYVGDYAASNLWLELGVGIVLMAVPVMVWHSDAYWATLVKLLLGVAGLVLALRSILGTGQSGTGLLNLTLPGEVSSVV